MTIQTNPLPLAGVFSGDLMKRWFLPTVLLLFLPVAHAQMFGALEMFIIRGQYRLATQAANKKLSEDPDNVELHAIIGVAWAKNSFFADALGAFSLCPGSVYYENQGIEAHADALRSVGRGEEAVVLRLQRLLDPSLNEGRTMKVLLGAVDDLREVGDLAGAMAFAEQAEALFPRSPMAHAVMADIYLDAGDLDAADQAIWAMSRMGGTSRGAAVQARRALLDGDYTEADAVLESARQFRTPTVRLAALRAEVLRQGGDPHTAAELLERNRWRALEAPELLQVRLMVYADMEDTESAAYWKHIAITRYNDNSLVQSGLAYLEAAEL